MNIFKLLRELPKFLLDVGILKTGVAGASQDPEIAAELAASPLLSARIAQISAEWRTVEADLAHGGVWSLFFHLPKVLVDFGVIQTDVNTAGQDPALAEEIDKCPALKAKIAEISSEWRAVEEDVNAIKH